MFWNYIGITSSFSCFSISIKPYPLIFYGKLKVKINKIESQINQYLKLENGDII